MNSYFHTHCFNNEIIYSFTERRLFKAFDFQSEFSKPFFKHCTLFIVLLLPISQPSPFRAFWNHFLYSHHVDCYVVSHKLLITSLVDTIKSMLLNLRMGKYSFKARISKHHEKKVRLKNLSYFWHNNNLRTQYFILSILFEYKGVKSEHFVALRITWLKFYFSVDYF